MRARQVFYLSTTSTLLVLGLKWARGFAGGKEDFKLDSQWFFLENTLGLHLSYTQLLGAHPGILSLEWKTLGVGGNPNNPGEVERWLEPCVS